MKKAGLAMLILGDAKPGSTSDDERAEPENGEPDGVVAMKALGKALEAKDYESAWAAMQAAYELCGYEAHAPGGAEAESQAMADD